MDTLNNSLPSSSDPKTAIVNQIRQEAAINNARQLIDVSTHFPSNFYIPKVAQARTSFSKYFTENEFPLLRKVRPFTRQLVIEKGRELLHNVHGEIYGDVEYC